MICWFDGCFTICFFVASLILFSVAVVFVVLVAVVFVVLVTVVSLTSQMLLLVLLASMVWLVASCFICLGSIFLLDCEWIQKLLFSMELLILAAVGLYCELFPRTFQPMFGFMNYYIGKTIFFTIVGAIVLNKCYPLQLIFSIFIFFVAGCNAYMIFHHGLLTPIEDLNEYFQISDSLHYNYAMEPQNSIPTRRKSNPFQSNMYQSHTEPEPSESYVSMSGAWDSPT